MMYVCQVIMLYTASLNNACHLYLSNTEEEELPQKSI